MISNLSIVASIGLLAGHVIAGPAGIWTDAIGDAALRRTDSGSDAPIPDKFVPIDLLGVAVQGWVPTIPRLDPYSGQITLDDADFVRIQIVVGGLVSPPGPIGLNGFPYNPYVFGDRPITGFIELDIDEQEDTGGELMPLARNRYLANVGRFGNRPLGSIAERIAQSADDLDGSLDTAPQIERSGAEFSLIMCGCFAPSILFQDGDMDSIFDPGERWIVEGAFFERFESFSPLSGLFGGSDFGLFDPPSRLEFVHSEELDLTTITLVFPLTNAGAAMLAGEPEQAIDSNLLNHTSLEEAIDDLIFGAGFATGDLGVLSSDWKDEVFDDFLEPAEWTVTALIGTAPLTPQPASFYVWTDTGFNELHGDLNFDEAVDAQDDQVILDFISDTDGTLADGDSMLNGEVGIIDFGLNFHYYDLNNDGTVSDQDLLTQVCVVDFTGDGTLNFFDVSAFLALFLAQDPQADFVKDGSFNFFDVSAFLAAFSAGCP